MAQHGLPTFDTLDQHTFIRPSTEVFEALGGALLTDIERLCGATIRVDPPVSPIAPPDWAGASISGRRGWSEKVTCCFPIFRSYR